MKKKLLKLISMAFLIMLCLGVNAQRSDGQFDFKTVLPVDQDIIAADRAPIRERAITTPANPVQKLEIADYLNAYVGDVFNGKYASVNLSTGEKTPIDTLISPPFPTGEDFDGTDVYRLYGNTNSGKIAKVDENGVATLLGTITGGSWVNTIGLAYDWLKDDGTWYFYNVGSPVPPYAISIYSFNMATLVATQVGATIQNAGIMRGLAMADDGYLYAISIAQSALLKIDPETAVITQVGPLGISPIYGQDVAFDRATKKLYASPVDYDNEHCLFGTIDMNSGAFSTIIDYGFGQHATLVICKNEDDLDFCPVVTNVAAVQFKENQAKITWNAPDDTTHLAAYKIYDGSTEIAEVGVNQTTYLTSALALGNHTFAVEANYDEDCIPTKVTTELTIEICGALIEGIVVVYDDDCFATVSWNAATEPSVPKYNVYMDDAVVASKIEETSYTHTESVAQDVDVKWCITQICPNGGESVPGCVTKKCEVAPPPCNAVSDAKAEVGCKVATITWNAVAEAKEYKIIGEGVETTVAGTTYTEEGTFENGKTYKWSITTICDEGSSNPADVSAIANCEGINEFAGAISIHPNPAQNGTVNITAANFAKVEVYNTLGQLMVTQNTPTVDVSNYQDGIYFFKVFDNNNNTAMKRISVIKF